MGNWDGVGVKTLTWKERLSEVGEDTAQYLERRYGDYCRDKNERSSVSGDKAQLERHHAKQKLLIEFGIILEGKLSFFLAKSRKELFEQMYEENESLDSYFKKVYDDFCKELDETNKALSFYERDSYTLHCEKSDKEKQLYKYKEIIKNDRFIEKIDKRRAEDEKMKVEDEKRRAKEKIRKEREIRREGFSNVKPSSFYEEMYLSHEDDEDNDIEFMKEKEEADNYFQENGKPKGEWFDSNDGTFFTKDFRDDKNDPIPKRSKNLIIYLSADTQKENQKHLNRCKELRKMIDDLELLEGVEDDWVRDIINEADILQEYLTKGYLITTQIALFVFKLNFWITQMATRISRKPYRFFLSYHPASEYDIDIYNDNFNIEEIYKDIREFIAITKKHTLTPIEELENFLKEHNNRITKEQYAEFIGKSLYIASKELEKFEAEKKLKVKIEAKGLNVFYV